MKTQVKTDITAVNEAVTTNDAEKIREALEKLKNSSMEIGKAIYSQQQSSGTDQQQQQEGQQQEGQKPEGEQQQEQKEEKK